MLSACSFASAQKYVTSQDEDDGSKMDVESQSFTVNGELFTMVFVEGGTFTMGCTGEQGRDCYGDEMPSHKVTLKDYYIAETEVTQALWFAVMGTTIRKQRDRVNSSWPLFGEGDDYPMYYVSYEDVEDFILLLNDLTGETFRLPTEAEWEYAARGGQKSMGFRYSGSDNIEDVAWYTENSEGKTHPVNMKRPNELGLYDMSGNVWEWCSDWYGDYGGSAQTNPEGAIAGSHRVDRGGGWFISAKGCRVASRDGVGPTLRSNYIGFRLVMEP